MSEDIVLQTVKEESRLDSRALAEKLGNKHKATFQLIKEHKEKLLWFGKLTFRMEASPSGQKERYALLNEDQCFFILSLSRNTEKVVNLKFLMVKAFGAARRAIADHEKYLIDYTKLHKSLNEMALANNTEPKFQHMNYNKLINKTFCIEPGTRSELDVHMLNLVAGAQALCEDWVKRCADLGMNHKDTYALIKKHLAAIAESRQLPTP